MEENIFSFHFIIKTSIQSFLHFFNLFRIVYYLLFDSPLSHLQCDFFKYKIQVKICSFTRAYNLKCLKCNKRFALRNENNLFIRMHITECLNS